ncbi:MAG: hypothetical protein Q4A27_02040 [bacterium]|nr:hypothetical protein [bacterium]
MSKIIEVNGIRYDAETGKALSEAPKVNQNIAENIHNTLQRSSTLNRRFVQRPENLSSSQNHAIEQFKMRHNYIEARKMAISKSSETTHAQISKFEGVRGSAARVISPISQNQNTKLQPKQTDDEPIAPVQANEIHQKALQKMRQQKTERVLLSPQEIKETAITAALEKSREDAKSNKKKRGIRKRSWFSKRMAGFIASCAVLALSCGYLVYANASNISMRIAAAQSGVDATLPQYVAQGYSLKGLAYSDGKTVNLDYSDGANSYTVKQAQTVWDSVALLENYVQNKWDKDYSTYQEKGLLIYKNRNNEAAWVNNGTLYTINGSNKLSPEDIRKIAASF